MKNPKNASDDDYEDVIERGWRDAVYEQGEQWTNPPQPVAVEVPG